MNNFFIYKLVIKAKAIIIVGIMGPGSIPLTNRPSPMASMRPGPKVSRPGNVRTTFLQGTRVPLTPNVYFFDAPRCPDALSPGCPFTRILSFPIGNFTKRNCQPAFHDISKCSFKNQSLRLQRNRKTLPTSARSGKHLHKKKNKSSFPK